LPLLPRPLPLLLLLSSSRVCVASGSSDVPDRYPDVFLSRTSSSLAITGVAGADSLARRLLS